MSHVLTDKVTLLRDRALQLRRSRDFFSKKGILEVDVPLLTQTTSVDAHIDLVKATCCKKDAYLHSSPEYGMKRLLAEGIGDIFQLSHVFRDEERGERHHPEFTMVEWYRMGFSFEQMIQETLEFLKLFIADDRVNQITYREAFEIIGKQTPESVKDKDHFFAFEIEPHLGNQSFTVITDFPPAEAALSKVRWNGKEMVAERFEIFYRGIELANGYHELTDPKEQEKRLYAANVLRKSLGKTSYPIDMHFLKALQKGIPDCCGVAVGFDRLMMLKQNVNDIQEVLPFVWENT